MTELTAIPVTAADGSETDLSKHNGEVLLVVNVASKCGFTPQYEGLEALQRKYEGRGFTVLGFPCNQFGAQEPGTEDEIRTFCATKYAVSFPMSSKIEVNGASRHALYAWLTSTANGFPGDIEWNFEKFLISRDGRVLKRYPPPTKPEDRGLMQDIADALEDEFDDED